MRIAFIVYILAFAAHAREEIVLSPAGKIIFTVKKEANIQREFFGADLWVVGKEMNGLRNVMSVLYNSKDLKLDSNIKKGDLSFYQKEMRDFAKEQGFLEVKFFPIEIKSIRKDLRYHKLTWSYVRKGHQLQEESYYVECGRAFYIAKATTFISAKDQQAYFKNVIDQSSCEP